MDEVRLTVRMPADLRAQLSEQATRESTSLNSLIVRRLSSPPARGIGPTPPGWATDRLSSMIDLGVRNAFATFHNHKPWYERLAAVYDAFSLFTSDFRDPPDYAAPGISADGAAFAALFMTRAQSAMLAGAILSAFTQVGDVSAPLRTSLEWAIYGYNYASDPTKLEDWLNRSDSPDARRKAKAASKITDLLTRLKLDQPDVGAVTQKLYDSLIDFGAHPNDVAMFGNMQMHRDQQSGDLRYNSLIFTVDDLSTRLAVKTAARVGLADLLIAKAIFPRRYEELALDETVNRLAVGL